MSIIVPAFLRDSSFETAFSHDTQKPFQKECGGHFEMLDRRAPAASCKGRHHVTLDCTLGGAGKRVKACNLCRTSRIEGRGYSEFVEGQPPLRPSLYLPLPDAQAELVKDPAVSFLHVHYGAWGSATFWLREPLPWRQSSGVGSKGNWQTHVLLPKPIQLLQKQGETVDAKPQDLPSSSPF